MKMGTEQDCFCELAPLYALDQLDAVERDWVEQQIAECPDLVEELATYESAIAALPYTAPALPVAPDLKQRLFERLHLDPPPASPLPDCPPAPYRAIRAADLNWQPHATPGVMIAIVHQDEITRELVGFVRAAAGVQYPVHRHAAIEEIFMLEGDLVIGDEIFAAGDYIRSQPGSSHAPYTVGGCRFFFHTSMDDDYPQLMAQSSC